MARARQVSASRAQPLKNASLQEQAFVISPKSGRKIQYKGSVYNRLSKELPPKAVQEMDSTMFYGPKAGRRSVDEPASRRLISDIEKAKTAPEESIATTLARTTQPALRQKLKQQMKTESSSRKSQTRGWAARAPQKGLPRQTLMKACGKQAFLLPNELKFPIMAKCGTGNELDKCECKVDCGGLQSAYVRARQWGYDNVARTAQAERKRRCPPRAASAKAKKALKQK